MRVELMNQVMRAKSSANEARQVIESTLEKVSDEETKSELEAGARGKQRQVAQDSKEFKAARRERRKSVIAERLKMSDDERDQAMAFLVANHARSSAVLDTMQEATDKMKGVDFKDGEQHDGRGSWHAQA